jgi:hypothetical protein
MNQRFGKRFSPLLIANRQLPFAIFPDNRKSLRRFIIWIEKFESAIQKGGKIYAKSVNVHSAALWSMGSGADLNLFTNV